MVQQFTGAFKQQPLLGVDGLGLTCRVTKEAGVEQVRVLEVTACRDVVRIGQQVFRHARGAHLVDGEEADALVAGAQVGPELVDVAGARKTPGHADDGHRLGRPAGIAAALLTLPRLVGHRVGRAVALQVGGQGFDRRVGEQVHHLAVQAQLLAQPGVGAHQQQRVAAQVEEVVAHADGLALQHFAPHRGDAALQLAAGFGGGLDAGTGLTTGQGQRGAVDLAVGIQRQLLQYHEGRGYEVLGQVGAQRAAQAVGLHRGALAVPRHYIGDDALVTGCVLAHQHQRIAQRRGPAQCGLDLAQLDAVAAHLDLVIAPADEVDRAVCTVAHPVARAIQPPARIGAEAVGDELPRRVLGPAQVAACDAVAAEVQLALHADRHRLAALVENICGGIGDRAPDRHRHRAFLDALHVVPERECRHLGRAVDVQQPLRRAALEHLADGDGVGRLAAEQEAAKGCKGRRVLARHLVEQRGGEEHRGDAAGAQEDREVLRAERYVARDADDASAVEQRSPDLEGRGVERHHRHLRDAIVRADLQVVGVADQAHDRTVFHLHALGRAGRAGGVDDIGQAGAGRAAGQLGGGHRIDRGGVAVDDHHVRASARKPVL